MNNPNFTPCKTVLYSIILTGALLILVEIGARLVLATSLATGASAPNVENWFHPFTGWVHTPLTKIDVSKGSPEKKLIETDADGNSITPFSATSPRLQVVVTGGSTMFGVGSSSNATTVPSLLERKINQTLAVSAEVTNLAQRGYQSFQEMLRLREHLLTHHVDIVVVVSGRNDAYYSMAQPEPIFATIPKRVWENAVPFVRDSEQGKTAMTPFILKNLGIGRLIVRLTKRDAESRKPKAYRALTEGSKPNDPSNIESRANATVQHYLMMKALADSVGARFVLVLQPTAFTWSHYPGKVSTLINSQKDLEGHRTYENRFYDVLRSKMTPLGVIDLTAALNGTDEPLYVDYTHYSDQGAEILSEALLRVLEPAIQHGFAQKR